MNDWFPTFRAIFHRQIVLPVSWPRTATRQRSALLRLLAVAIENNLPLAALLEQWMEDEGGSQRLRLAALVAHLKKGKPLAEAMELVPGLLQDAEVLAVRFDSSMGTRTATLRQLLSEAESEADNAMDRVRGDLLYVGVVVVVGMVIVTFLHIKILPVFQNMFHEFGMSLPPVMRFSIEAVSTAFYYWWLAPLVVMGVMICVFSTRTAALCGIRFWAVGSGRCVNCRSPTCCKS